MKDEDSGKLIIGEATPVRIGFIISMLALFATGIWWAASINSKLDSILAFQTTTQNTFTELKAKDIALDKDISDIKLQNALLDVSIKALNDKVNSQVQVQSSK